MCGRELGALGCAAYGWSDDGKFRIQNVAYTDPDTCGYGPNLGGGVSKPKRFTDQCR